jgi:hypothetical protein
MKNEKWPGLVIVPVPVIFCSFGGADAVKMT